jgi:hypothetical protein
MVNLMQACRMLEGLRPNTFRLFMLLTASDLFLTIYNADAAHPRWCSSTRCEAGLGGSIPANR